MTRKSFLRLAGTVAAARPLFAQEDTRVRRWRDDLRFLVSEVRRLHPNPFFSSSEADFNGAVSDLDQRIPELADYEVVVAFSRLLATLHDGHTSIINFPAGAGLRQYPLRLEWFPEGMYAVQAGSAALPALGGKLLRIADTPVDEVWDKARPLISADNEWTVRSRMPSVLVSPEVLHALRIVPQLGSAAYTFEADGGGTAAVTVPISGSLNFVWPRPARPLRPLYRQDPGLNYWFDYLEASKTFYIKYNACIADPTLPVPEFARQIAAFLRQKQAERLVLDVRNNGGGDNSLFYPLAAVFAEAQAAGSLPGFSRWFGIIGRQTASSAMWNAMDAKRMGATLVGEPTGGKPNAPGNVQSIQLPNSQIYANVSTRMWNEYPEFGDAGALAPDLPVSFSVEHYRAQRDPFLEKALE